MRDNPIPKHMWLKCVRNYDYFTTCVLLSIHIPWKRTKLDKTIVGHVFKYLINLIFECHYTKSFINELKIVFMFFNSCLILTLDMCCRP